MLAILSDVARTVTLTVSAILHLTPRLRLVYLCLRERGGCVVGLHTQGHRCSLWPREPTTVVSQPAPTVLAALAASTARSLAFTRSHRGPMDEHLRCGCEPVTWPLLPTAAAVIFYLSHPLILAQAVPARAARDESRDRSMAAAANSINRLAGHQVVPAKPTPAGLLSLFCSTGSPHRWRSSSR
jgi:hypothetical protein